MTEKKRILLVHFNHETNSFSPSPADETAYRNSLFLTGNEIFSYHRGRGLELGAFLEVLEKDENYELIPTVSLNASPSGPVTKGVYDFVIQEVTRAIKEQPPFDGVLIACHGAMVSEEHQDGEGDLFEYIRTLVGEEIPLMVSLDLHANVTAKMARCATTLLPYECYPHIDNYETGLAIATLMKQTLEGNKKPIMAYRRIPYLLPLFPSEFPEMQPLYRFANELQQRPGVLYVRFTHGFFPADIEEMGMSVLAITDGDSALADSVADEMQAFIEANISNLKRTYPTLDEALDVAVTPGEGPVVLGDSSDNPGAGGLGDTTHILRRILERGITGAAVATIVDPESVKACIEAGVGNTIDLSLGGWSNPSYSGGPLAVKAYVKMLSDGEYTNKGKLFHGAISRHGKTAVVEIAGNTVLVTSVPKQPMDLEVFRSHGIAPEEQRILVTKSAIHYRASYSSVAREMISLSLQGYSIPTPEAFAYRNWKGTV